MKKNSIHWFWGLLAYVALGLFGFMLYPSIVHMRFYFSCIGICALIDGVAFFVCCAILRKFKELAFWKLAVYLALIVAPSIIIASFTTYLSKYYFVARDFVLWPNIPLNLHSFLFFCALIVLISLIFVLWRVLFNLTIRRALWVSIPVGLINTIACWMAAPIFK